jgi:hypothetical protein
MRNARNLLGLAAVVLAASVIAVSCVPPEPPPPQNWSVNAHTHTNVVQNEFQESPGFPLYSPCPGGNILLVRNCWDEPYILQIGWRVTYGIPGSTTTWVRGTDSEFCNSTTRSYGPNTCAVPASYGKIDFPNVKPLDVIDVLAGNGKLELLGVMTLAWEKDLSWTGGPVSITNQIAGLLKESLDETIASGVLPNNVDDLIDDLVSKFTDGGLFGPAGALAFQVIQDGITALGNPDENLGISMSVFPSVKGDLRALVQTGLVQAGFFGPKVLTFDVDIVGQLGVILNLRPLGVQDFNLDFVASETGILNNSGTHRYSYSMTQS